MESNFDKYIRKSDCLMDRCPYENESLGCIDCVNRMIEEHDETIRDGIRDDIWDAMQRGRVNAINAIKYDLQEKLIEEINNPYQDQSLCQGLFYGIQRCDWYLSDDKEQGNE